MTRKIQPIAQEEVSTNKDYTFFEITSLRLILFIIALYIGNLQNNIKEIKIQSILTKIRGLDIPDLPSVL